MQCVYYSAQPRVNEASVVMHPLMWRFTMSRVLLYLVLSSVIFYRHAFAQLSVDEGPKDVTVVQGGTATFICDLSKANGFKIYWYYQEGSLARYLSIGREVGVSTPLSSDLLNRLSIIGDESQGEFTLRITNVRETDRGAYSCLYARGDPGGSLETAGVGRLTVLIPPSMESPVCVVEDAYGTTNQIEVGALISLYCYTSGGDPSPTVAYYRDGVSLTRLARSIGHQYRLTADDNGVAFTCVMTTPALEEPRSCSVMPLQIRPEATILPAVLRTEQGTSASFQCYGEGIPSIANYRWRVTNVDTGLALPSDRYTVKDSGRLLEIEVRENLDVLCVVSVPSGLSGNATASVEVIQREFSTVAVESTPEQRVSKQPSASSPPAAVIAVVIVFSLVMVVLAIVGWFLWRRRQRIRSKIPVDPKDGYKMGDLSDEYSEIGRPTATLNGQTPDAGTYETSIVATSTTGGLMTSNPLYAPPDICRVESVGRSGPSRPPNTKPVKNRASNNNEEPPPVASTGEDTDGALTRLIPVDMPMYAQTDKSKKTRKSEEITRGEYSTVPVEDPQEEDSGLVYADLDLESPSPSKPRDITGLPSVSEKTVYATIHT